MVTNYKSKTSNMYFFYFFITVLYFLDLQKLYNYRFWRAFFIWLGFNSGEDFVFDIGFLFN